MPDIKNCELAMMLYGAVNVSELSRKELRAGIKSQRRQANAMREAILQASTAGEE